MNSLKTVFLMTLMMVLFIFVGNMLVGKSGMTIALIFSLAMNFGSYWFSDKIVLKMYRAQPVTREQQPKFYNIVEQLAKSANLNSTIILDCSNFNDLVIGRRQSCRLQIYHNKPIRKLQQASALGCL